MTNTYHRQAVLQADLSYKLNRLKQQASTKRLLAEVQPATNEGSAIWKTLRQVMVGFWLLESSTRSGVEAST
jgi:hypothetical protein